MGSKIAAFCTNRPGGVGVSILVVVDWVQRPRRVRAAGLLRKVSILVVVDWVQRSKLHVYANRIEVYVKFTRHVFFDEGAVLAC